MAELEAQNNVAQEQLDRAHDREQLAVREVQRHLERTEYELSRAKERVGEAEARLSAEHARSLALERELSGAMEGGSRKERLLKEEKERNERLVLKLEELKVQYEGELAGYRTQIQSLKDQLAERTRQHELALEQVQADVRERLPKITASAIESVESSYNLKVQREIEAVQLRCEGAIMKQRREIMRLQGELEEMHSRQKSSLSEDRLEVEKLRAQMKRYQRRCEELEDQLEGQLRSSGYKEKAVDRDFRHGSVTQTPTFVSSYSHANQRQQFFQQNGNSSMLGHTMPLQNGSFLKPAPNSSYVQQSSAVSPLEGVYVDATLMASLVQGQLSLLQQQLASSLQNSGTSFTSVTNAPRVTAATASLSNLKRSLTSNGMRENVNNYSNENRSYNSSKGNHGDLSSAAPGRGHGQETEDLDVDGVGEKRNNVEAYTGRGEGAQGRDGGEGRGRSHDSSAVLGTNSVTYFTRNRTSDLNIQGGSLVPLSPPTVPYSRDARDEGADGELWYRDGASRVTDLPTEYGKMTQEFDISERYPTDVAANQSQAGAGTNVSVDWRGVSVGHPTVHWSDEQLSSDMLLDGGFHANYWKAKYLRMSDDD